MRSLRHDADRICGHFALIYRAIDPERANVKSRYGICYDDGSIKIRLRHAATGEPLKYSSLVNTLCHELAHLRHFDHGPRFQAFYARLLAWARQEGIYRPGRKPPRPLDAAPARPAAIWPGSNRPAPPPAARSAISEGSPVRTPTDRRGEAPRPRDPVPRPMQLDLFA